MIVTHKIVSINEDHNENMSETKVIQEEAKVCQMSTFLRQKRLSWYGHIRRGEEDNLSREEGGGLDGCNNKDKTPSFNGAKKIKH